MASNAPMKWSVALPTDRVDAADEFITADAVAQMAAAVEAAGFDACFVTDHPFPPAAWVAAGGHHALDPLVTLGIAGAATTRLRLQTNMLVVPYRNPFLAAKGVATLDRLTDGRVILGVAGGYLEPEFAAVGADFERRGAGLDEALVAMKAAWTGEPVEMVSNSGAWTAHGNAMLPRPVSTPHPPIWVGGNGRAAIRRAVTHGQGWAPFPARRGLAKAARTVAIGDIEALRQAIAVLRDEADEAGRTDPLDVCTGAFTHPNSEQRLDPAALLQEVEELAAAGVTWLTVGVDAPNLPAFLDNVARFGAEVIAATARSGGGDGHGGLEVGTVDGG